MTAPKIKAPASKAPDATKGVAKAFRAPEVVMEAQESAAAVMTASEASEGLDLLTPVVPMSYEAMREVVKDAVTEAMEKVRATYPMLDGKESREVERFSRPGFIPSTDGGWIEAQSSLLGYLEDGGARHLPAVAAVELETTIARFQESALDHLKSVPEDWAQVCATAKIAPSKFRGKDIIDVANALYEAEKGAAGEEKDRITELRERIYDDYEREALTGSNDAVVSFDLTVLLFSPENERCEAPSRQWEARVLPSVLFGCNPPAKRLPGPEVQVCFGSIDELKAQLPGAVDAGRDWLIGLDTLPDLNHPAYTTKVKLPKYNGPLVATQGSLSARDAANILITLNPGWTKEDHQALSKSHAAEVERHERVWGVIVDQASMATWGRPWAFGDYKVSGVGSDEFSPEFKERLRHHAHAGTKHRQLSGAHEAASSSRRLKG